MAITAAQIWNNFFAILVMALVIEVAVSSIFSIPYLKDLLQSTAGKSAKMLLIIIIAAGLCYHINGLRVFYGMKILTRGDVQKTIHIIITVMVVARMASLLEVWFANIKKRNQQMG